MKAFWHAHATHPEWRTAVALAAAQIEGQRHAEGSDAGEPTLGWVYFTETYAASASALLADLQQRWPSVQWVGASGVGIAASGVEYFDEPALALMLAPLPVEQFRVFSGTRPLKDFPAHTAQVHADASTMDLDELVRDMSQRTGSGYLFGGLASGRDQAVHVAQAVLCGGLSGVAFDERVAVVSRVSQGCQPVGPTREVTSAERNVVITLDHEPALECLLRDVHLEGAEPRAAVQALQQILVGLSDASIANYGVVSPPESNPHALRGAFGSDTRVRHLVGLDMGRRGVAIGDVAEVGSSLAFCTRNTEAARRDLMRICAEVREEVEPEALAPEVALAFTQTDPAQTKASAHSGIAGAVYVSCAGRGGAHFGAPSAELAVVRHALGHVPLVGFFAAGEIAREHIYGYTGILTVFPMRS